MNKITRKQNSLYCDNQIRKDFNINFNTTPEEINQRIKNYHTYYDKYIKKKLGKKHHEQNN